MQRSYLFSTFQNVVFIIISVSYYHSPTGCYHKIIISFSAIFFRPLHQIFIDKNMGKPNIDKKDIAKSLYLNGNFTQEEIADKVGTTRQTVSRWIKEGG